MSKWTLKAISTVDRFPGTPDVAFSAEINTLSPLLSGLSPHLENTLTLGPPSLCFQQFLTSLFHSFCFKTQKNMAEEVSTELTVQRPAGIPWHLKTTDIIPDGHWRMLLAIIDTVLPSVQRELASPRHSSRSKAYISDTRYQEALSRLRKDTVILDSASEQDLDKYLSERPSDDLLFQQVLKGMLHYLPQETRTSLFRVLYFLRCVASLYKGARFGTCERDALTTTLVHELEHYY